MAQQIAQMQTNQMNMLSAQNSAVAAKTKTVDARTVAAPLKLAEAHASAQATPKNASEYMVSRVGKEALAKMQLYKPSGQVGVSAAPAKGSFAPQAASYARRLATMPSLSDIADNGINPLRAQKPEGAAKAGESGGCKTCQERTYQDGSDDAGVSFQTPTHIPASTAGVAVASHEGEHVTRETAKAQEEGRVVTQAKVTFQFGCCPECNKMYIAGGTTTIATQGENSDAETNSALELMGATGEETDETA